MELHIKDRLYIPQILPAQGNFMEFAMKREILKKVGLTKEDQEKYEIKEMPDEGKIVWNTDIDRNEPLAVDFTQAELEYIQKGCEALADKAMPDDFWLTVEKIYNAIQK